MFDIFAIYETSYIWMLRKMTKDSDVLYENELL